MCLHILKNKRSLSLFDFTGHGKQLDTDCFRPITCKYSLNYTFCIIIHFYRKQETIYNIFSAMHIFNVLHKIIFTILVTES